MKLISLCSVNPLARQINARGSDSASQCLAYCSGGETNRALSLQQALHLGSTSTSRPPFTSPGYLMTIYMRHPTTQDFSQPHALRTTSLAFDGELHLGI